MRAHEAKIGRVLSVSGSQVVMLIEKLEMYGALGPVPTLQMGELVKMNTPSHTVFGMVTGLTVPIPSQEESDGEMKLVELELLGEMSRDGNSGFRRGVSVFPALGVSIYPATHEDLELIYARPSDKTVRIGTIHPDAELPAYIATDELLGKHFAVLGTTGSGKSCAVALMLHAILEQHPNGHVVLLDPHNEYTHAFGPAAEVLSPGNLQLPYWLFSFEEIAQVVLGAELERRSAEMAILNDLIPAAKRQFLGFSEDGKFVTPDTPIPYQIGDIVQLLDEASEKLGDPKAAAPYAWLKARLRVLKRDARFAFMFGEGRVEDNMTEILSQIFRIPVSGKPITIIDLSAVPSEILNVVVSVLCRTTFDFALWSEHAVPIMLVCEEAHRYAPQDPTRGFEPTKRALSRIAKEGRKYGVSLCVVSQRPSELATDILSQCNTIFALRMGNQKDQDFVRANLSESARGLLDFLPSLRNAEAIAVGEGVSIPLRLCFETLPEGRRPKGGTAPFSAAWQDDWEDKAFLDQVVERWRRQTR